MSNNEEENKIVVSHYTISNIERFFEHFEIKMCDGLAQSIATYKKDPDNFSPEEIEKLRNNVCRGWMEAVKINERYEAVMLQEMIETSMEEQAEGKTDV